MPFRTALSSFPLRSSRRPPTCSPIRRSIRSERSRNLNFARPNWSPQRWRSQPSEALEQGRESLLVFVSRWRPVRMKGLHGLKPPRLAFGAFAFGPNDWLPIGSENEACTGIDDFHAVAAGLVDVEKERLLNGVFVWTGLDEDAGFQKNISGA